MFYFSHSKKRLSLTLIICQLFLVSSFLFIPTAWAEDETTTPPETTETAPPPAEENFTSAGETPDGFTSPDANLGGTDSGTNTSLTPVDPPLAVGTTEPTAETPETLPVTEGSATTTDLVITDPSDHPDPLPVAPTASAEQSVTLGSSSGGSAAINLAMQNGSTVPRVLASWAMNTEKNEAGQYLGVDDNAEAGAQFLPSGQYQINKSITLCSLVSQGTLPTKSVSADLFYPENISFSNSTSTRSGCGDPVGQTLTLPALDQSEGLELFCHQLKNNNYNLVTFEAGLDYNSLCGPNSLLATGQARLYCQDQEISYSSPAGSYKLKISAKDNLGAQSPVFENSFKYLELTAFAVDFDAINYGPVQLNTPKVIKGDDVWHTPLGNNPATVSNVGNTRLRLIVSQNDFGLGGAPGNWNVRYRARIGSVTDFTSYEPSSPTALAHIMGLSETNNLDFGIEVFRFPAETSDYSGQMTLSAEKADYLTCQ